MRTATLAGLLALLTAVLIPACEQPVEPEPESPPAAEDHEFDTGSRIDSQNLNATQIENLALLAQVWGFAKYHHPRIVDGSRNWDYELFRAIPVVLAAPDRTAATDAILTWLDAVGPVPACNPCAQLPPVAYLLPDNGWIHDTGVLGAALSERLVEIHRNRPVVESQKYVSFAEVVGNPVFNGESYYTSLPEVDAGYRLLALFRFWNIIQYWFPYRDIMEEDWFSVLREFIPDMMQPLTGGDYRRTLIRLHGRVHDTHANLWSDLAFTQPPLGTEVAPLSLRFVDGKLVMKGFAHEQGLGSGMDYGDVISSIDGQSVASLVDSLRAYYPASNEPTRLRDIARNITRGNGPVLLAGEGVDGPFSRMVTRVPTGETWAFTLYENNLSGSAFRMLSDSVAYIKISNALRQDLPGYMAEAANAALLVIDCRGYPDDFLPFALGGYLVTGATPFAKFTVGDPTNPGAFLWTEPQVVTPLQPHFSGKVLILVDEMTQSSSEYHAMAFRSAPNAIVAGSTTAGADGNVSAIPFPGGPRGLISGIGVFYPDGTPTQRIGIVPDLELHPTIEGFRSPGGSVLHRAITHALGRDFVPAADRSGSKSAAH